MGLLWRAKPDGLEPAFLQQVKALLTPHPNDWYVTYAFRSLAEQDVLYQKYLHGGPKAAPPGHSAHNFGMAVDVVLDVDPGQTGLQASWNTADPSWQWLFQQLATHPYLKSGVSFGDGGHIEKRNWERSVVHG